MRLKGDSWGWTISGSSTGRAPLPTGGYLEQADGTAWMALFCQNMVEISAELAMANPAYINLTMKFVEHFLLIASGMIRPSEEFGMWDEQDGFFYDVLKLAGRAGRTPEGALHGGAAALLRGDRFRKEVVDEISRGRPDRARVSQGAPGTDGLHS